MSASQEQPKRPLLASAITTIIVGWYASATCICAFAVRSGRYISFAYPGADTYAIGINSHGQVVGEYTFDYRTWHGFSN